MVFGLANFDTKYLGWAEQSEAQQNQSVGLCCI
jgi:hypothetical protein